MNKKFITSSFLLAALGLTGCDKLLKSFQQSSSPIIARVGNIDITVEQLQDELDTQRALAPRAGNQTQMAKVVLERMIERTLYLQGALAQGIDKEPTVRRRLESERLKSLANLFRTRLMESYAAEIQKEARNFYDAHPELNQPKTMFQLSVIVVKTPAEKNRVMQLLKKGTPFEQVASRYSNDLSTKETGGRMPLLASTEPPSAFEKKLRQMKKGEIGTETLSDGRYQIFRKDDTVLQRQGSYSDVEEMLVNRFSGNSLRVWLDKKRSETTVQIDQQALNSIEPSSKGK